MYKRLEKREKLRKKRQMRVRKKVRGSEERPRMTISKTNKHLFVQVIDDVKGVTLVSAGTPAMKTKRSRESAVQVGKTVAELAKVANIEKVVFDRGRHKYHGIIADLVNAAREAGLQV